MMNWQIFSVKPRIASAARHLLDEGFYDDAVSRTYYSMYFSTVALLLTRNVRVRTHTGLIVRSARNLLIRELLSDTTGEP
jgi:uncharacterized protein (UPF0332 family)